jgi:hypothetical protein
MRGNIFVDKVYDGFIAIAKQIIKDPNQLKVAVARKKRPVMDRWRSVIMPAITKFVGIKKKVNELNESGTTGEDVIQKALAQYEELYEVPFDFESCWRIAKDHPKWSLLAMPDSATSSRATVANCSHEIPSDSKQSHGRDAGRKLAAVEAQEYAAFETLAAAVREESRERSASIKASIDRHNQILEAKLQWRMFEDVDDDDAREFRQLTRSNILLQAKLKNEQLRTQLRQHEEICPDASEQ